jgi:hypothetical protein
MLKPDLLFRKLKKALKVNKKGMWGAKNMEGYMLIRLLSIEQIQICLRSGFVDKCLLWASQEASSQQKILKIEHFY